MKGRNNSKKTLKSKAVPGGREIQEKHMEERKQVSPLKPMNELQAEYIKLIRQNSIVIATGLPGTSKTYIPTVMACDDFRAGNIDKIYITRPNISNSKSLGFFGGDLEEKCANWLGPVLAIMNERMGANVVELAIKSKNIQFVPFEVIKGWTFNKSYIICDEAEDITYDEVRKITTRVGRDARLIMAGDLWQSELKDRCGLRKLIEIVKKTPQLESYVGLVDFDRPSDIVRSDLCRELVMAFVREEG